MLDPSDSLGQYALPQHGQGAPLWPLAQAHYKAGIQVLGYPTVKKQGSVCNLLPFNQISGPERTWICPPQTHNVPSTETQKEYRIGNGRQRDSGDSACILHSPAITFKPPPHLLVSRSTVMLSVGHMVCAEDARAGVALERQKICREWVRLQV